MIARLRRTRRLAALVSSTLVLGAAALAHAERVIALAPLSTLGSEDTSAAGQATTAALERALAGLPDSKVVAAAQVAQAIKRAKRPTLAGCDGDASCLRELGQLVGAEVVVTGQAGGLASAQVIYLSATATASGQELGSTTWTAGAGDSADAAVVRLLAPRAYTGTLALQLGAVRASVYVDGSRLPPSGNGTYALSVGTHALRVNHPEFRDFVRFVDIGYQQTTKVDVQLQPLPVVQRAVEERRRGDSSAAAGGARLRWWAVAGGAIALGLVAGAVGYFLADDFEPDVTLPEP
jgi:hypothetical protein